MVVRRRPAVPGQRRPVRAPASAPAARVAVVGRPDPPTTPTTPGPDPRADLVAPALAALPATDAEVLRLWAWEDLAPREIAVALGTTANAVSSGCTAPGSARLGGPTPRDKIHAGAGHRPTTRGSPMTDDPTTRTTRTTRPRPRPAGAAARRRPGARPAAPDRHRAHPALEAAMDRARPAPHARRVRHPGGRDPPPPPADLGGRRGRRPGRRRRGVGRGARARRTGGGRRVRGRCPQHGADGRPRPDDRRGPGPHRRGGPAHPPRHGAERALHGAGRAGPAEPGPGLGGHPHRVHRRGPRFEADTWFRGERDRDGRGRTPSTTASSRLLLAPEFTEARHLPGVRLGRVRSRSAASAARPPGPARAVPAGLRRA